MIEQVKREGDNNKLKMGEVREALKDVINSKGVASICRYGVVETYLVPADVMDLLIQEYKGK